MKRIKSVIITLVAIVLSATPVLTPVVVSAANIKGNTCQGVNDLKISTTEAGQACKDQTGTFNNLIETVVNLFSAIIGVVAVIMILYGGFRYITSGGSSDKVSSAKNTIIYGIIGLVIVGLAQVIVQFVLNKSQNAETP